MARTIIVSLSVTLLTLSGCFGAKPAYRAGQSGYGDGSGYTATESTSAGRSYHRAGPSRYRNHTSSDRSPTTSRAPADAPRPQGSATRGGGSTYYPPPAPGSRPAYRYRHRYREPTPKRIVTHRPEYRPGLGTVFGERMHSRVSYTAFRRAGTRPDGTVSIHYNDRQGLGAMTHHLRRTCCTTIPPYQVRAGITVQLVDAYRRPLSGLQIAGRTIVLGQAQHRYGLLIRNFTGRRYEIVASVDGLDVIDGRRASISKRGYILGPYATLHVKGYRTSASSVAAFRFGSVRNSYAKRSTGTSRNVGVVGVAAFGEYVPHWSQNEVIRRLRAQPFSEGYAQPPSN